jgi:hypothetical protein
MRWRQDRTPLVEPPFMRTAHIQILALQERTAKNQGNPPCTGVAPDCMKVFCCFSLSASESGSASGSIPIPPPKSIGIWYYFRSGGCGGKLPKARGSRWLLLPLRLGFQAADHPHRAIGSLVFPQFESQVYLSVFLTFSTILLIFKPPNCAMASSQTVCTTSSNLRSGRPG